MYVKGHWEGAEADEGGPVPLRAAQKVPGRP